jgi:hypothetical protein
VPVVSSVTAAPPPLQNGAIGLTAIATDTDALLCGLPDPLSYAWRFTVLPTGSHSVLLGADTATPSFVPDVAATYAVQVIVTDSTGLSSSGTVSVDAKLY